MSCGEVVCVHIEDDNKKVRRTKFGHAIILSIVGCSLRDCNDFLLKQVGRDHVLMLFIAVGRPGCRRKMLFDGQRIRGSCCSGRFGQQQDQSAFHPMLLVLLLVNRMRYMLVNLVWQTVLNALDLHVFFFISKFRFFRFACGLWCFVFGACIDLEAHACGCCVCVFHFSVRTLTERSSFSTTRNCNNMVCLSSLCSQERFSYVFVKGVRVSVVRTQSVKANG